MENEKEKDLIILFPSFFFDLKNTAVSLLFLIIVKWVDLISINNTKSTQKSSKAITEINQLIHI